MRNYCLKTIVLMGVVTLGFACASAAGKSTKTVSRTQSVENFNEINVTNAVNVIYTSGTPSMEISAPECAFQYISTTVKNDELKIIVNADFNKKYTKLNGKITVTVSSPYLSKIKATNASTVTVKSDLTIAKKFSVKAISASTVNLATVSGKKLDIESQSASTVNVSKALVTELEVEATSASTVTISKAQADEVEADADSAATLTISGTCNSLETQALSASTVNLGNLIAKDATATVTSMSTMTINAENATVSKDSYSTFKNRHN